MLSDGVKGLDKDGQRHVVFGSDHVEFVDISTNDLIIEFEKLCVEMHAAKQRCADAADFSDLAITMDVEMSKVLDRKMAIEWLIKFPIDRIKFSVPKGFF